MKFVSPSEHLCQNPENISSKTYWQVGSEKGKHLLILGESPAANGWRISGKAFHTPEGRILPTGRNLNKILELFGLSIDLCCFTELVKCFVGKDRKALASCAEAWWPSFCQELKNHEIRLILVLGMETSRILSTLIGKLLVPGQVSPIHIQKKSYQILPIYHPSPISPHNQRRNREIFGQESIIQAMNNVIAMS